MNVNIYRIKQRLLSIFLSIFLLFSINLSFANATDLSLGVVTYIVKEQINDVIDNTSQEIKEILHEIKGAIQEIEGQVFSDTDYLRGSISGDIDRLTTKKTHRNKEHPNSTK